MTKRRRAEGIERFYHGRVGGFSAKLALASFSMLISLALLEGGFRLYERAFLIHETDASEAVYDLLRFGYNDHRGFLERARAPGEYRILSFGDSFAESATLPQYSYARVLEDALDQVASGKRAADSVRVVNFGRNGTSFHDYARQLELWQARVEFDAVLLNLYSGNDFKDMQGIVQVDTVDPAYRQGTGETRFVYGPGVDIPRRYRLRVLDYAFALYYTSRYQPQPGQDAALYQPRALQYPEAVYLATQASQLGVFRRDLMDDYTDAYAWLFKLMRKAADLEATGVRVATTIAPPHLAVDPAFRAQVLESAGLAEADLDLALPAKVTLAIARAAGVEGPVIDLAPCLRGEIAEGEPVYWGTNTHWSIRGNAIVGERLAEFLAGEWFDASPPTALCRTEVEPAKGEVAARLSAAVELIRDQLAFEASALAPLGEGHFADRQALVRALADAGFREAPSRLKGAHWGDAPRKGDARIRPHGLKQFIRPHGYVIDLAAPGTSTFVAFLNRGALIGVARTHVPVPEAGLPGVASGVPNTLYSALIKRPVRGLSHEPGLWVLALTTDGGFAFLETEVEPQAQP